jgi:hypothetical protein
MDDKDFQKRVRALSAEALRLPADLRDPRHLAVLRLCHKFLKKFHNLHQWTVELSGETRVVSVSFCKRPPC